MREKSAISGKRGEFGDAENQRFLKNKRLFLGKSQCKGGYFLNMENTDGSH